MKILHVTNSIGLALGGTAEALVQLCEVALGQGHLDTVWCAATDGPSARPKLEAIGVKLVCFSSFAGNWHSSPGMLMRAARQRREFDVVHGHGLWQGATSTAWAMVLVATKNARWNRLRPAARIPRLVLSPHGQLDDWSFRHRGWKKKPYLTGIKTVLSVVPVVWHGGQPE